MTVKIYEIPSEKKNRFHISYITLVLLGIALMWYASLSNL